MKLIIFTCLLLTLVACKKPAPERYHSPTKPPETRQSTNTFEGTAPTAALTYPLDGAVVSGKVMFSATTSDYIGVSKVEFYRYDWLVGTDTNSPYAIIFDTTTVTNGLHRFSVKAYTLAGNTGTSVPVSVTVSNAP